eukprot:Hpha_TRINITY_DN22246_c0_g1::TRINITY_DN22246_c0_g1_i1::g.167095::m.167095
MTIVAVVAAWAFAAAATQSELDAAGITCTLPSQKSNAFAATEPECPWASWRNDSKPRNESASVRYCYECRWCPFRHSTCCEREDEPSMLKRLYVSGEGDWSCFITVAWFLECGKCSPYSRNYVQLGDTATLRISPDASCRTVRPCREACGYIWKQCKSTTAMDLDGNDIGPLINKTLHPTEEAFCANAGDDEGSCYNAATTPAAASVVGVVGVLLAAFVC